MGFLVHSFNDMTKRLRRAREEATRSQQAVERERERLAIILARLSTGVLAVDRDADRAHRQSRPPAPFSAPTCRRPPVAPLPELAARQRAARPVRGGARGALRAPGARSGASSSTSTARRPAPHAACAPARRCRARTRASAFVIVFDDITALLQAQRDAAWGEVARRLAHEIKNPLTPIQLSAERLRRRLLAGMNAARRGDPRARPRTPSCSRSRPCSRW